MKLLIFPYGNLYSEILCQILHFVRCKFTCFSVNEIYFIFVKNQDFFKVSPLNFTFQVPRVYSFSKKTDDYGATDSDDFGFPSLQRTLTANCQFPLTIGHAN